MIANEKYWQIVDQFATTDLDERPMTSAAVRELVGASGRSMAEFAEDVCNARDNGRLFDEHRSRRLR